MKVEGPGKSSGVKGTGKTGGATNTGSTAFSGMLGGADEVEARTGVSGAGGVSGLDALLALQDVGSSTEENRKRAKKRGMMLLDELDNIKLALLNGSLSEGMLQRLTQMVQSQRDEVDDPVLKAVLDEIDLRAQVEIAKFSRR